MVTVCQRPSLTVVWRVRVVSLEKVEEELCDRTREPSSSYYIESKGTGTITVQREISLNL